MKKTMIDLKGVVFSRFEQKILCDINLTIDEGDFVVLVGPNGSGKSTLVKILNGTIRPSGGQVFVDGDDVAGKPTHQVATVVSTLTQDLFHSTFSDLTVAKNMELALARAGSQLQSRNRDFIASYLTSFNRVLPERLDILAGHLSGGQRQSLALAMCFAHTPKVLLLDEHTSALDPKAAETLMELTNLHVCEKGLTTIMITHSLEHAMRYGNRLIAMNEGRIIANLSKGEKQVLTKTDLVNLAY